MFYLKVFIATLWFIVCCLLALIVGILRWRHPSGGYVFTVLFTNPVAWLLGIKVDIKNKERLVDFQPCVYLGNHQSNLDIVIQAQCYRPNTVCIGKKELLWLPFFGLLFFFTGNILLDRKHHGRALDSLEEAKDFLTKRKISVYMFPEGTRNKNSENLLPFKKGAFHLAIAAQVPIIPVVSCPVKPFINLEKRKINPGVAKVEVLEPIPTAGLRESDVDALMLKTYERMQTAFKSTSRPQQSVHQRSAKA